MLTGFLGVETSHPKHTHHPPGSLEPVSSEAAAACTLRSVSVPLGLGTEAGGARGGTSTDTPGRSDTPLVSGGYPEGSCSQPPVRRAPVPVDRLCSAVAGGVGLLLEVSAPALTMVSPVEGTGGLR